MGVNVFVCVFMYAILMMIEGRETAFNGSYYQVTNWKTVEKPETDPQLLREWQYV